MDFYRQPIRRWTTFLLLLFALNTQAEAQKTADEQEKPAETENSTTQATETEALSVEMDVAPELDEDLISSDNPVIKQLNEEIEILRLKNALQLEKHKQELLALEHQKDKFILQNELQQAEIRTTLAALNQEKEKLAAENELLEAKQTKALAELSLKKQQLELENAIAEEEHEQMWSEVKHQKRQLEVENSLQEEKNRQEELAIELKTTKLSFELSKLEYEKSKNSIKLDELSQKISEREQKEIWESQANKEPEYLEEPFVDGSLILSDRQILLDGIIVRGTAEYITERIAFYNNKNEEYPIFLIIDFCAGGSVMEGAQILKAMQTSQAPVYVVVKAFAASMAATITAMAERSFAYPDAVIIHHQMWNGFIGNITEQKEYLEIMKNWARRLMTPVASKMGVTIEEFIALMYENNSAGNWREFADEAVSFKWVDYITDDIRDTSHLKKPEEEDMFVEEEVMMYNNGLKEEVDAQGNAFVKLPRLSPPDFYYLYNPDNYYR